MNSPNDHDLPGIVAPPPLIFGTPLFGGFLVDRWHPLPFLPADIAQWLGVPLVVMGCLGLFAVRGFHRARTSPNPWRPTTALVTTGIYGITRNPMYLGMLVWYVGGICWANTLWPLFLLPVVLWVMQVGVIHREERYLEARFGAEYLRYKEQVRRWL